MRKLFFLMLGETIIGYSDSKKLVKKAKKQREGDVEYVIRKDELQLSDLFKGHEYFEFHDYPEYSNKILTTLEVEEIERLCNELIDTLNESVHEMDSILTYLKVDDEDLMSFMNIMMNFLMDYIDEPRSTYSEILNVDPIINAVISSNPKIRLG